MSLNQYTVARCIANQLRTYWPSALRADGLPRRVGIHALVGLAAFVASTSVVAADPATTSAFLPLQEEFCATEGGALIEEFGGLLVVFFFVGIVAAALIAGTIESLPMTGWWNQMGYSMMGKIPIAILFVIIIFSLLTIFEGTFGLTAPSCVPVIG